LRVANLLGNCRLQIVETRLRNGKHVLLRDPGSGHKQKQKCER
jgi:hypothetical protein